MGALRDLSGVKFGRLTALNCVGSRNGKRQWLCLCECGASVTVPTGALTTGNTQSCGCRNKDIVRAMRTKHGDAVGGVREYRIWRNMITRCTNPNTAAYENYGGRGIKVCDEWLGDGGYVKFLEVVGRSPNDSFSIDRIDTNGDYEPGNVRWATDEVQARNTRLRVKNKSGLHGVSFEKRKRLWRATIHSNGKQLSVGRSKDYFEAVCARKSAEARLWTA